MSAATSAQAYVIRNATVKIATTEYANLFTKCRLVPSTDIQTQATLVPDGTITDVGNTTWQWQATAFGDWTATTGLADMLNSHAGEQIEVSFAPKRGGRNAAFTAVAIPVDFGGDGGSFNLVDFTLPVVGEPDFGEDDES